MNKNIRDLVLEAMTTDDSFNGGNSRNIIKLYNSATLTEKELIDNIFVNLCGYYLSSQINDLERFGYKLKNHSQENIGIDVEAGL